MIEQANFYLRHSLNDLRVNGQRTFFALLCIAAGVAAIVSLGTLASMIQQTLTGNLQLSNRADISIELGSSFARGATADTPLAAAIEDGLVIEETRRFFGTQSTEYYLSPAGVEAIQAWLDANYPGSQVTYRAALASGALIFFGLGDGASLTLPETGASLSQLTPVVIDGARYPLYGTITMQDGTPLADALNSPDDIVLSDRAARDLSASIGDRVRVSGANADFTVTGIVDTAQEVTSPAQALEALFGFYFLDVSALERFSSPNIRAETTYIALSPNLTNPASVTEVEAALQTAFPYVRQTTTEDLRRAYEQLSAGIDQLTAVMGLVSILIGSIGIVNTMQVIVRRRTLEVAVLKTIGLQANQVTTLFLVEALIMGVIGSLAGIVLGWLAVFVLRGTAEQLIGSALPFAIDIPAAVSGFIIGVAVTAVFGFLPTLTAGRVRPGTVLRPTETIVPRSGCLPTLGALGLIIVVLSLVASGTVGGSIPTAFGIIIGAFIAAGVLYALLSLLIWLFGRFFPSLGVVDLKISLRQMLAGRSRAAMTLLALVVGVFSLSLITLLADSINNLLRFTLTEISGGNVLISVIDARSIPDVETVLNDTEGVNGYRISLGYRLELTGLREGENTLDLDALRTRIAQNRTASAPFGGFDNDSDFDPAQIAFTVLGTLGTTPADNPRTRTFEQGRNINVSDAGQRVIILQASDFTRQAGIEPGDALIYRTESGETLEYTVIGLAAPSLASTGFEPSNTVPAGSLPESVLPSQVFIFASVEDAQIPALRRNLASVRGAFALETAALTQLIETLLGAFTAFPTMVALLGLVVGGVVIANSVALTTMERRKEIAIMKSVGLQRERVLLMILLENGILGLIGGLIGVGIGLVGLLIALASFQGPTQTIPYGTALLLMLLCIGVALIAAVTTAWGASGEKPLNVLRYE
jgi:ABC-type antimicrobial peptide transport system permease subunit